MVHQKPSLSGYEDFKNITLKDPFLKNEKASSNFGRTTISIFTSAEYL
jgi:hypothetical protein